MVVEKHGWEERFCSHGGLCSGLRVGEGDTLVRLAILTNGDFLAESVQSLVSRLLNLRLIFGLLIGIFFRMGK